MFGLRPARSSDLLLAYQAGEADNEECHRGPAKHGRCPAADDPAPPIEPPELGLVNVDNRDNHIDRVAERIETWVAGGAPGRCRDWVHADDEVIDGHDRMVLLGKEGHDQEGHE